ncbi:MAG: prolyl oligopeptidase family serine peptidase [Bacteroidota bacterium]|nr:prolyl oligopeptidase family serine peptidase [Bacteroidota bacterium]
MKRFLAASLFFLCAPLLASAQWHYPKPEKGTVVDDYFGTKVADPYRWMEDVDAPKTKEWVEDENKLTFDYLSKIPFRDKIKKRIEEIWNYPKYSSPQKAGAYYLFYKNDGLQPQSVLYIQEGPGGTPRVLIDPNTLSADGTVALNGISVSWDNKYLAYMVAKAGSDWQEIYVLDLATGKKLDDHIQWNKFGGANWYHNGFFYSRFDEPKGNELTAINEFQKMYYHKIGTPQSADSLVYEDKTNSKRSHDIGATEDERYLQLYIGEAGKKGNMLFVKDMQNPSRGWLPIVTEFGNETGLIESEGTQLFIQTNIGAPRSKVVVTDISDPSQKNWHAIIPEGKNVLENTSLVDGKLVCTYMQDASQHVYFHDLKGKMLSEVQLPTFGSVFGFSGRKKDTEVFYTFTSFTYPPSIYRFDMRANTSTLFRRSEVKFDPEAYEAKQIFYHSKDGTRVPMFIVQKKGLKNDGKNPCFLYGYGGFNISMTPSFSSLRLVLLENGVIFAMPNLRGGGEYGEQWHDAGTKLHKQNVFDDFISAADYLCDEKYTSHDKLALAGGSNGGLLVGAVMTERPDICKVALPAVGVMDMLRYHKFTIGAHWASDYGTSEDNKEMFQYLYHYSPLHNIKEGVKYPATMVTTADHDDRVVPAHSFKFTATLQEKGGPSSTNPLLIRIETKAGHGGGKPTAKIIEETADEDAFMFYNMGITPKY